MTAKKIHTVESVLMRTDDVGECMEWQGMIDGNTPKMMVHSKKLSVRRVLWVLMGKPLEDGDILATTCGNSKCVSPDHIERRSASAHMDKIRDLVMYKHPLRIAKLQKAQDSRRVVDKSTVSLIRSDPRRPVDIARETGVDQRIVAKIRRGESYKVVRASANPFAGLIRQVKIKPRYSGD